MAEKFIPQIGTIKEGSSNGDQAILNEIGNLVACATNLGFALELYLKGLLTQLDLPVPQTHDLRLLYDLIPQPVRALIEDTYDTALPKEEGQRRGRWRITLAIGPLKEPSWDDDTRVSLALPDVLKRSSDLFQAWRYIFEFRPPQNSPYQFHQFEYGPLRCAAEAMRIELMIRMEEAPPTNSLTGES